jgi:hypothetical protein
MTERPSLWQRLFGSRGTSSLSQRQEKVLHYIIGRINEGAPLQEVLQEQYVRRNCSQAEIEQIIRSPELIGAAREQLGESFSSEEFKP